MPKRRAKKRKMTVGMVRSAEVTMGLAHWSHTCRTYSLDGESGGSVGGISPMTILGIPDDLTSGTRLRITVEVISIGRPCPIANWEDFDKKRCTCPKPKE